MPPEVCGLCLLLQGTPVRGVKLSEKFHVQHIAAHGCLEAECHPRCVDGFDRPFCFFTGKFTYIGTLCGAGGQVVT